MTDLSSGPGKDGRSEYIRHFNLLFVRAVSNLVFSLSMAKFSRIHRTSFYSQIPFCTILEFMTETGCDKK